MPPDHPAYLPLVIARGRSEHAIHEVLCEQGAVLTSFLNPISYMVLRPHADLWPAIDRFFFDGIVLSQLVAALSGTKIRRSAFDMTSLAPIVFRWAVTHGRRVAVIGARAEENERFCQRMCTAFPGLQIAYAHHGYFDGETDQLRVVEEVAASGCNLVIVGLGCPLQERFGVELKRRVGPRPCLIFTCGGFIHQTQANLVYYPPLINRLHLRWLYRLIREPHTRQRFLHTMPRFFAAFARDSIGQWIRLQRRSSGRARP